MIFIDVLSFLIWFLAGELHRTGLTPAETSSTGIMTLREIELGSVLQVEGETHDWMFLCMDVWMDNWWPCVCRHGWMDRQLTNRFMMLNMAQKWKDNFLLYSVKRSLYHDYFCSGVRNQSRAKLNNISRELISAGTGTQRVSVFRFRWILTLALTGDCDCLFCFPLSAL